MNLKTTIVALVLAIVLGGIAIYKLTTSGSPSGGPAGENGAGQGQRLFDPAEFDPEKVNRIAMDKPATGERFVFAREGEDWRQTEPVAFDMNAWSVRSLATAPADLIVEETIPAGDLKGDLDPAQLKLDPPMATVTYGFEGEDESAESRTIHLGRMLPAGKAYVRLALDGDAYVVGDDLHQRVIEQDPREWRAKEIFQDLGAEASRAMIEHSEPGRSLRLGKTDGKWRLSAPVSTHADAAAVSRYISSLSSARLRGFSDDNPASVSVFGLDQPWATVVVETDRATGAEEGGVATDRQTLLLGHPIDLNDETRYAKRGETTHVFTISGPVVDQIVVEPTTLISKTVLDMPAADVRALNVDGPDGRFRLERQLEGWQLTDIDGSTRAADTGSVDALLARLTTPTEGVEIKPGVSAGGDATATAPSLETAAGSFLARVAVEGFGTGETPVATVTVGRRERDGVEQLVYDDGSGVLRYAAADNGMGTELPEFLPDEFPLPGAATQGNGPAGTQPDALFMEPGEEPMK